MAALTASKPVSRAVSQDIQSYPVVAAVKIYEGAYVGRNPAGYVQPLQAGDEFVGIAYELADNTSGAAGAISVRVHTQGDYPLTYAGARTDVGKPVFATNDNDLSLSGNPRSWVGWIVAYLDSATVLVRMRRTGETLANGVWGARYRWDGARGFAPVLTAGGEQFIGGEWRVDSIGAGIVAVGVRQQHLPTRGGRDIAAGQRDQQSGPHCLCTGLAGWVRSGRRCPHPDGDRFEIDRPSEAV